MNIRNHPKLATFNLRSSIRHLFWTKICIRYSEGKDIKKLTLLNFSNVYPNKYSCVLAILRFK